MKKETKKDMFHEMEFFMLYAITIKTKPKNRNRNTEPKLNFFF